MAYQTTPELPYPRLAGGRFASLDVHTDEHAFQATGVRIALTTRNGGVSQAPYDSLNLGNRVDDDPAAVAENRRLLVQALGAGDCTLINPLQVHGDTVLTCLDAEDVEAITAGAAEGADALVVGARNVAALLCFADCTPIIVLAPTGHFAVIHAGWRGVVNRISEKAIMRLAEVSGMPTSSLNVYVGAHIGACCFEVGPDVHKLFTDGFGDTVAADAKHIDQGRALRISFQRCGIDPDRIADLNACTVCNQDRWFSHRGSGGRCGRQGAFAVRLDGHEE